MSAKKKHKKGELMVRLSRPGRRRKKEHKKELQK